MVTETKLGRTTEDTPVVIYLRMSSDDQQASIDRQRKEVAAYCKDKGYTVIREYVDEGKSASHERDLGLRTEFSQMIADSKSGDFRLVVCWDASRFARLDPLDGAAIKKILRDNGVSLDTAKEGLFDWSTSEGRWKDQGLTEVNAAYSRNLSKEAISGRLQLIHNNQWPNGGVPYGYDRLYTDGTQNMRFKRHQPFRKPRNWKRYLVINVDEASIIKWIFHEFAERDTGLRQIARRLEAKGVPTPDPTERNKRGKWCKATVRKILSNKAYIGIGHIGTGPKNTKRQAKFNRIEPTEVPGCCPAIIASDVFERVQVKLTKNAGRKCQPTKAGILSGFLVCGHCNRKMHKANARCRTGCNDYVCQSPQLTSNDTGCRNWRVYEEDMLPRVMEWLVDSIDVEVLKAMQAKPETVKLNEVNILKDKIETLSENITVSTRNLLRLKNPDIIPDIEAEITAMRVELETLKARLKIVEQSGKMLDGLDEWWHGIRDRLILVGQKPVELFVDEDDPEGPTTYSECPGETVWTDPSRFRSFLDSIGFRASITFTERQGRRKRAEQRYVPASVEITADIGWANGQVVAADTSSSCRSVRDKRR